MAEKMKGQSGGKKDLTGKRFGKLTVIENTGMTEQKYRIWRCRCDCGGEIMASTKQLKSGVIRDCGCVPKTNARNGRVAEDLTGKGYGYLTVLKRVENKNGRTCWLCRCECGKEKEVMARDLKSGKVKSCGCHTYDYGHNRIDLTGQRFGRLTALRPTERRDRKGSVYWMCRCDCGGQAEVPGDRLVQGNVLSCGCLKSENQKEIAGRLHRIDGTCLEILEKRKYRRDNKSGFRGVFRMKNGHYRVYIGFKGKRYNLGTYSDYEEAVDIRLQAEKELHERFVTSYYKWKELEKKDPSWGEKHPFVFDVRWENGCFYVNSTVD